MGGGSEGTVNNYTKSKNLARYVSKDLMSVLNISGRTSFICMKSHKMKRKNKDLINKIKTK